MEQLLQRKQPLSWSGKTIGTCILFLSRYCWWEKMGTCILFLSHYCLWEKILTWVLFLSRYCWREKLGSCVLFLSHYCWREKLGSCVLFFHVIAGGKRWALVFCRVIAQIGSSTEAKKRKVLDISAIAEIEVEK